jgi:hypothetical protein
MDTSGKKVLIIKHEDGGEINPFRNCLPLMPAFDSMIFKKKTLDKN